MKPFNRGLGFHEERRAFFPLFVDMTGRRVLVVGGGKIAERRVNALLRFGARITALAPKATEGLERLAVSGAIALIHKEYEADDAARFSPFLVIAATDRREVNRTVGQDASGQNILASIADCQEECSCYFPALIENGHYIAAMTSRDGNHTGTREMAQKIRRLLDEPQHD